MSDSLLDRLSTINVWGITGMSSPPYLGSLWKIGEHLDNGSVAFAGVAWNTGWSKVLETVVSALEERDDMVHDELDIIPATVSTEPNGEDLLAGILIDAAELAA